jgi:DnaJ-class molecular chaperone
MIKTVRELGMPFYEKNFVNGNLFLSFNITFPNTIDSTQKELLSKVLIAQTPKPISETITEKYFAELFTKDDENTHHMGGKKERKQILFNF